MEINYWSFSFLLGCAQAAFLVLALLIFRSKSVTTANLYLALFIFIFFLDLLDGFLFEVGFFHRHPEFIGLAVPIVFLYGPCLLFYVYALVGKGPAKRTLAHTLWCLGVIIALLPFYLLDGSEKLSIALGDIGEAPTTLVTVSIAVILILSVLQPAGYLLLCLKTIKKHGKSIEQNFSFKEKISLNWLRNILVATIILWIFHSINVFLGDIAGVPIERLTYFLMVLLIYSLGIMGLRQPEIFVMPVRDAKNNGEKYQKSALGSEQLDSIAQDLNKAMSLDKLYLDNKLTMSKLASTLNLSTHYLSQAINAHYKKNFFEYINSLRIEHAKQQIASTEETNILQIALDAGFNSKSAFYTAFKKSTHMTPMAYKQQLASETQHEI